MYIYIYSCIHTYISSLASAGFQVGGLICPGATSCCLLISCEPAGTASAEGNRDAMVRFWLNAPADQLEPLWKSHFGTVTVELIGQLTPQTSFTTEQVAMR